VTARLERTANVVVILAAVSMAVVVVHREVRRRSAAEPDTVPKYVSDWKSLVVNGARSGPPDAAVTVVEFADLECPFCRLYEERVMRPLRTRSDNKVEVVYMHYPLTPHPHALSAARAAECAAVQGRFTEFVDVAFRSQDSIAASPWLDWAKKSGVRDARAFKACIQGSEPMPRIDSGVAIARRIGVRGTPAIMVNGWLYPAPPEDTTLSRAIAEILRGREPFGKGR